MAVGPGLELIRHLPRKLRTGQIRSPIMERIMKTVWKYTLKERKMKANGMMNPA